MHPKGAKRNIVDQAIFSNDGPNLKSPAATSTPSVIPKIYKLKKRKAKGKPKSNKDIPNRGEVNNIAGTKQTIKKTLKKVSFSILFIIAYGWT